MEGKGGKAQVVPDGSKIANYGFDVTPARLVTGIITEKGICNANEEGISTLFKKYNVSRREKESNQFIITGSATGKYSQLKEEHFSLVNHVTIEENKLECTGQIMASSESMSHAAVYIHNKKIKAIIHIHDNNLWKKYLNKLPSSSINAAYGTPQMALSIAEKINQLKTHSGVLIMGGHSDGIIAFGNNLDNAILLLQKL
jgi:L-ribulose-5-phosphate 4-epimerase